jgi:hypothetical protein
MNEMLLLNTVIRQDCVCLLFAKNAKEISPPISWKTVTSAVNTELLCD